MSLYSGQIVGVEGANTQYVLMTMARCTREYGLEVEEVGFHAESCTMPCTSKLLLSVDVEAD